MASVVTKGYLGQRSERIFLAPVKYGETLDEMESICRALLFFDLDQISGVHLISLKSATDETSRPIRILCDNYRIPFTCLEGNPFGYELARAFETAYGREAMRVTPDFVDDSFQDFRHLIDDAFSEHVSEQAPPGQFIDRPCHLIGQKTESGVIVGKAGILILDQFGCIHGEDLWELDNLRALRYPERADTNHDGSQLTELQTRLRDLTYSEAPPGIFRRLALHAFHLSMEKAMHVIILSRNEEDLHLQETAALRTMETLRMRAFSGGLVRGIRQ